MSFAFILEFLFSVLVGFVFTYFIYAYFSESGLFSLSLFVISEMIFLLTGSATLQTAFFVASLLVLLLYSRGFYISFLGEVLLSIYALYSGLLNGFLLSISLGTMVSLLLSNGTIRRAVLNEEKKGLDKITEIKRDVFQILTGLIVISLLFLFGRYTGSIIVLYGSLLLYTIGNFSSLQRNSKISRFLFTMEREGVSLGQGAISLASGVFFLFGMIGMYDVVLAGIFLVLIADPVATIAGKTLGGPKLPYNKMKTVSGTLISMLISLLFVWLVLGLSVLPYAIVGILVESITTYPMDDNITVPVSLVLSNYLFAVL